MMRAVSPPRHEYLRGLRAQVNTLAIPLFHEKSVDPSREFS